MKIKKPGVLSILTVILICAQSAYSQDNTSSYYKSRQIRLMEQMSSGFAIVPGSTVTARNGAGNNVYFTYLTPFPGGGSYLILVKSPARRILFTRFSSRMPNVWSVAPPGMDEARQDSDFDEVWPSNLMDSVITKLLDKNPTVYIMPGAQDLKERITRLAESASIQAPDWQDPTKILNEMRVIKDELEISYLRKAIDITSMAQRAALDFARPGVWEYQVEALIEYTFRFNGADGPGFTTIVGSGTNSCILHYSLNNKQIEQNDLLLMDIGAAYKGYTADITRTIPPSGKFTPEQLEVYELVLKAQKAAIATMMPGRGLEEAHNTASDIIMQGLYDLGLVTDLTSGWQRKLYILYENSHYIGLTVHDVGDYGRQDPKGRELLPGMVLTIEPGIYLNPLLLETLHQQLGNRVPAEEIEAFVQKVKPAYEKYKGIGVRIEDDVLITQTGQEVLSAGSPKEVAEITRSR